MAIIAIYQIDTGDATLIWEDAWALVETNDPSIVVCREIIESDLEIQEDVIALKEACNTDTELNQILLSERADGATHAFVKPVTGKAVFGIELGQLSE